ncbi:MAG: PEP-CTERM sorting domain-containing protein [Pirellulales bacterium]
MRVNKCFLRMTLAIAAVAFATYVSQATAGVVERRVQASDDDAEQHLWYADDECADGDTCPPDALTLTEFRWMEGNGSSDLELGKNRPFPEGTGGEDPGNGQQISGMRWLDINIPAGATITSAYIQFAVNEADKDIVYDFSDFPNSIIALPSPEMILRITGELSVDAATYADKGPTTANEITDRPETTALVDWTVDRWSAIECTNAACDAPFPTNLFQEIPEARTPDLSAIIQEIVDQGGWASGNALALMAVLAPQSEVEVNRTANSWNSGDSGDPPTSITGPLLHIEFIPEPTSLAIVSLGLMSLLAVRRRRS